MMENFGSFNNLVRFRKKRVNESEFVGIQFIDFIFGVDVFSVRIKENILNIKLFMRIK